MAEKEAKKPVMDVEKPGTTPASATSRPVIIGRGPAIKDPMVNEAKSEDEEQPASQPLAPAKKKTIQPLSDQPASDDESNSDTLPAETDGKPGPEAAEPTPELTPAEEEATAKSEAADVAQKLSDEELKRQQLADKLTAEKKYFVPIGAVQKKRTARTTALLLIVIILIIGGALLAIDAELIQTDIKLPFDLLK